ncbi:hypothetical protein ACU61A_28525 [Pseudonocardia sichuanensis]
MPRAPKGLGPSGRRLWRAVLVDFGLAEHELALLLEACRTVDQLDAFTEVIAAEGVIDRATGRAHPAVVESRQQRLVLTRVLATLRVPPAMPPADEPSAPQGRSGARGAYGTRS